MLCYVMFGKKTEKEISDQKLKTHAALTKIFKHKNACIEQVYVNEVALIIPFSQLFQSISNIFEIVLGQNVRNSKLEKMVKENIAKIIWLRFKSHKTI